MTAATAPLWQSNRRIPLDARCDLSRGGSGLEVQVVRTGRDATVTVKGEIDLLTAPDLEFVLSALVAAGTPGRFRVEVGGVTFCDSSGLAVFLDAYRRAAANGHEIVLVGPGDLLRRVLRISGLASILTVEERPE